MLGQWCTSGIEDVHSLNPNFFFKAFREFPRYIKVGNNKVGQNDFISEIRGTVKILFVLYNQP
jgi:hypothetical protein